MLGSCWRVLPARSNEGAASRPGRKPKIVSPNVKIFSAEARGEIRPQRDERGKVCAVRRDQILHPGVPAGALRIYFAGGAFCQISNAGEMALAVELLGRLGAKR